jgi:hypothetical protein
MNGRLLLEDQGRPADFLAFEVKSDLDVISGLDEGDALVHA